jgi:CheY-like chemotaxis protein
MALMSTPVGAQKAVVEVLLVEDNPGDVRLTRHALEANGTQLNLSVARDGVEALAFLRREEKYENAPRPQLVLLDLNMPRKGGHEVLAEMKRDLSLCCIPVVIFTSSEAEIDVVRSYKLGASAYLSKPVDSGRFASVLKTLEDFWFDVATLPLHCRA